MRKFLAMGRILLYWFSFPVRPLESYWGKGFIIRKSTGAHPFIHEVPSNGDIHITMYPNMDWSWRNICVLRKEAASFTGRGLLNDVDQ